MFLLSLFRWLPSCTVHNPAMCHLVDSAVDHEEITVDTSLTLASISTAETKSVVPDTIVDRIFVPISVLPNSSPCSTGYSIGAFFPDAGGNQSIHPRS
jgi:hypothetical protein